MVSYPVRIAVNVYRGSVRSKALEFQARLALSQRIEQYLNNEMELREKHVFTYAQIATALSTSAAKVSELLSALDGGGTGITISK